MHISVSGVQGLGEINMHSISLFISESGARIRKRKGAQVSIPRAYVVWRAGSTQIGSRNVGIGFLESIPGLIYVYKFGSDFERDS